MKQRKRIYSFAVQSRLAIYMPDRERRYLLYGNNVCTVISWALLLKVASIASYFYTIEPHDL